MPPLDHDRCYAAAASRDARFDGRFVTAVRTTGIYCRPSCPAITPKRSNVEFHPTAAAAQQRGFRACKRCLPDATPGSPEWNMRRDVVGRAMRLIADGEVERSGVSGLARRLGYSERHLNRLLTDDLGAGPLAIARAQRAHTARILIETTELRLTDVAFAAGFGSVRQFNDTVREIYAASPSDLRSGARRRHRRPDAIDAADTAATTLRVRLPHRGAIAAPELVGWFAARAVPGIERVSSMDTTGEHRTHRHERTMLAPRGPAAVVTELIAGPAPTLAATITLSHPSDLAAVVQRLRRLYDLDADPAAVDERLGADAVLAPLVARRPGLRSPGSVDAFETAVRAIIGQQVSVSGAATVTGRLVEAAGAALPEELAVFDIGDSPVGTPRRLFPTPEQLVDAADDAFAMPTSRRATLRDLAAAVLEGRVGLDPGADPDEVRTELMSLRGVGPWTAGYVALRGLSDPDVGLTSDLVVARTAARLGLSGDTLEAHAAARWSPWRSYATQHLWAATADTESRHATRRGAA